MKHAKPINKISRHKVELQALKVGGTYIYHWALKYEHGDDNLSINNRHTTNNTTFTITILLPVSTACGHHQVNIQA
jgi:hypothetical protein